MNSKLRSLLPSILFFVFVGSIFIFPVWRSFFFRHLMYLFELMFLYVAWIVFSIMKQKSKIARRPILFSIFLSLTENPKLIEILLTGIKNNLIGIFVALFLGSPFVFPIFLWGLSEKYFFISISFETLASIVYFAFVIFMQICAGYWTFRSFKSRAWAWGFLFFVVYTLIFWFLLLIIAFSRLDKKSLDLITDFLQEPTAFVLLSLEVGFFSGISFFLGSVFASVRKK